MATLVALLGAMFVAMGSASAATGDLNADATGFGVCDGTNVTGITYDDGTNTTAAVACPEGAIDGDWIRVAPVAGGEPDTERMALSVRIDVTGDSDLIVPNDGSVTLMATPMTRFHNDEGRTLWIKDDSFTVSGELGFYATGGTESGNVRANDTNSESTAWGDGNAGTSIESMTVPIRAGATEGEYTVSMVFLYDHDNDGNTPNDATDDESELTKVKVIVASRTITVGDGGMAADSAELDFGPRAFDIPATAKDESNEGALFGATNTASSIVRLKLSVTNTPGNPSGGNGATSLSSLFVSASGAELTINQVGPGGVVGDTVAIGSTGTHNASANIEGANTSSFYINVAPIDDEPRSVSVSATVIGKDGSVARTEDPIDLKFSGDSDSITVTNAGDTMFNYNMVAAGKSESGTGDSADTNHLDSVAFLLSAADSAGNGLPVPDVRVDVTDHEGKRVSRDTIVATQIDNPGSFTGNKGLLLLNNNASKAKQLGLGEYTVKVTNKAASTQSAETTFMVVGGADSVSIEVSNMAPSEIGDIIEVTVTVLDEMGIAVADDTLVDISSSDASADSDSVVVETGDTEDQKTDDGVATATFVAVGPGTSVITAVADGKSAVSVVTSTAGASDSAMPEEEASVACLSNLNGFATWACGVESSASEIFGLVSGRGATALHLWNGSAWVRYSVVDGTMVPGSSDFMVAENDILYISN